MLQYLINVETLEVVSSAAFKAENKSAIFPVVLSDASVESFGYKVVKNTAKPEYDGLTHNVALGSVEEIEGSWYQNWNVVERPDAADRVRSKRNELLTETDWVVIMHTEKGTNIPMEWEAYRQALRDITTQTGFPYDIAWPTKPE